MFDDKKQTVEDMFSGTEHEATPAKPAAPLLTPPPITVAPQTPRAEQSATVAPAALPEASRQHSGFGIVKVLFIVIVVLGLVAGAAYAAYRVMVRQSSDGGIVNSVSDEGLVTESKDATDDTDAEIAPERDATPQVPENKGTFLDSDGDGLTNAEELEAGTLANNPDTDSDGLGDREEVEVYETNPRNPDTDDDTFLDGQEVAGGYNPNGEGRLFNVPSNE